MFVTSCDTRVVLVVLVVAGSLKMCDSRFLSCKEVKLWPKTVAWCFVGHFQTLPPNLTAHNTAAPRSMNKRDVVTNADCPALCSQSMETTTCIILNLCCNNLVTVRYNFKYITIIYCALLTSGLLRKKYWGRPENLTVSQLTNKRPTRYTPYPFV
jgi:hypothetical protein